MPIEKISLTNFKSFGDSVDIPLAPLTVLFGRNNSGKSSILQSLLLLRQSSDSPYGPRLNLRGPLYPAGSYADLVHQHRASKRIVISLRVSVREQVRGDLEMEYSSDEPRLPRLARLAIECNDADPLEIRRSRGAGGPYELFIGDTSIGGDRRANFLFPVNRFLPLIGEEPPRVGRPSPNRERSRRLARGLLAELEESLNSMRAVGAFRSQPKRRYEYQGLAPSVVDATGENVVNALIEDVTTGRRRKRNLVRGVNQWLRVVGRVRLLPIKRISKSARIFELRLKDTDSGRWANFADVGFGIGQAFPVFVEGLRTPVGGSFLVQEPEIHLHPDAQLAMADFLIELVRSGRRVIAETHSENVLLRLRKSVAKGEVPPNEISIIHVDKNREGTSTVRRLSIDTLGQIAEWPQGFMEEATRERMDLMTEAGKRAAKAELNASGMRGRH